MTSSFNFTWTRPVKKLKNQNPNSESFQLIYIWTLAPELVIILLVLQISDHLRQASRLICESLTSSAFGLKLMTYYWVGLPKIWAFWLISQWYGFLPNNGSLSISQQFQNLLEHVKNPEQSLQSYKSNKKSQYFSLNWDKFANFLAYLKSYRLTKQLARSD